MEKAKKRIVIDTNVIFSSLLKSEGVTRLVLTLIKQREDVEIFVPKSIYKEIQKYRFEIARRAKISTRLLDLFIKTIFDKITVVDVEESFLKRAKNYVRDKSDIPFVAVCLKTKSNFLLTFNTKDFKIDKLKRVGIQVLTPVEFLSYLGVVIGEISSQLRRKKNNPLQIHLST